MVHSAENMYQADSDVWTDHLIHVTIGTFSALWLEIPSSSRTMLCAGAGGLKCFAVPTWFSQFSLAQPGSGSKGVVLLTTNIHHCLCLRTEWQTHQMGGAQPKLFLTRWSFTHYDSWDDALRILVRPKEYQSRLHWFHVYQMAFYSGCVLHYTQPPFLNQVMSFWDPFKVLYRPYKSSTHVPESYVISSNHASLSRQAKRMLLKVYIIFS